ncbi:hypothetical protein AFLA70_217g001441 [Aspergillus flavus AF70]|nr:hypothetical protein AFLA70_217g001441 [Aspergillus flavus AF70]
MMELLAGALINQTNQGKEIRWSTIATRVSIIAAGPFIWQNAVGYLLATESARTYRVLIHIPFEANARASRDGAKMRPRFSATLILLLGMMGNFGSLLEAKDAPTIIQGMQNLNEKTHVARQSLEGFDGSFIKGLLLARDLFETTKAAEASRKAFEDADPLSYDDVPGILENYHTVRKTIDDALKAVPAKVDSIDSMGVRMFATGLLRNFAADRTAYEKATKAKIPVENHTSIQGPIDSLANSFDDAISLFI